MFKAEGVARFFMIVSVLLALLLLVAAGTGISQLAEIECLKKHCTCEVEK